MSVEAMLIKKMSRALKQISDLSDRLNSPAEPLLAEMEDGSWKVKADVQIGLDYAASIAKEALKGFTVM